MTTRDTIVIGASAGGVQALSRLVADLPANLPAAVFIVLRTLLLTEQKDDLGDEMMQTGGA